MAFSKIIETERLILRPFRMEDAEAMWSVNEDPEVNKYTGDDVSSLADVEKSIRERVLVDYDRYGFGRFVMEWKENNEVIGFTGLKYLDEHLAVDLGYRMKKSYWGKGIATESSRASLEFGFGDLGLHRIIALAMEENHASINVMNKLGFSFDGWVVDSYGPAKQYSLTKNEWNAI